MGPLPEGSPQEPRAGRNLPVAIAVGIALVAWVAVSLWFFAPAFIGLASVGAGLAAVEICRATRRRQARPPTAAAAAGTVLLVGGPWLNSVLAEARLPHLPPGTVTPAGVLVAGAAVLVARMRHGAGGYLRDCAAGVLAVVYVGVAGSFVTAMLVQARGSMRVLVTILVVVAADTGAYAVGAFAGRHHLWPAVSPHKTWEGVAGGVLMATAVALGFGGWLLALPGWQAALLGVVLAVMGMVGDLVESMMKRDAGVKDMSDFIPGHGGVLDRLDSILFAAPFAWLLLTMMVVPV